MRVAVISDTHALRRWKRCPPAVARQLDRVDVILHAGDVCVPEVLDELSAFAPVKAVLGNNDSVDVAAWGAPAELLLGLDGLRVGMAHDDDGRAQRAVNIALAVILAGSVALIWV